MEEALLPFGSVGVFVDHLSGTLYAYPTALHLRAGQHLVLEHGGEAQVAKTEAIPSVEPVAAVARRTQVATAERPAVSAATATVASPKPRAAAGKPDRAATKQTKAAPPAIVATKTRPVSTVSAASSNNATVSAASSKSAPLNW
jgi:hypothetical protein